MSGADELPWMMLAFMGGTTFIVVWCIILAKLAVWLLPKIFPELKQ